MVEVAKKLMEKAGKERKLWISGLFDYRVTPQSGNIASPLQLLTQHTPREKNLPQLPSTLGTPEMYQTHQELIKRQVIDQREITLHLPQVHQFGFSTGRMLHGNKQ